MRNEREGAFSAAMRRDRKGATIDPLGRRHCASRAIRAIEDGAEQQVVQWNGRVTSVGWLAATDSDSRRWLPAPLCSGLIALW